jgi:hypothetical protein
MTSTPEEQLKRLHVGGGQAQEIAMDRFEPKALDTHWLGRSK